MRIDLSFYLKRNLVITSILIHSDQEFQYTSKHYHINLQEMGCVGSHSCQGNYLDYEKTVVDFVQERPTMVLWDACAQYKAKEEGLITDC